MKKILSIILAVVLVLSLCACGASEQGGEAAADNRLMIGYAREDITPSESVPLAGYGMTSQRFHNNTLDFIYGTCIAATQGEETVLFFAIDMILPANDWVTALRSSVSQETGVAQDRIMVSFSHTHSAPDPWSSEPVMQTYKSEWTRAVTKAATKALADQAPATISATKLDVPGMNFVRHYQNDQGQKGGYSDLPGTFVGHAEQNDPQMRLLKFDREGDKKDILLMNWQAHPCFITSTQKDLSADYIGVIRQEIEMQTDMKFAFFLGATGNHNTNSVIESEAHKLNMKKYGAKLAEVAVAALPELQPVEGEGIKASQVQFEYDYNHEQEDKAVYVGEIMDVWEKEGFDAAKTLSQKYGLSSPHVASSLKTRVSRPKTGTIELNVVRIGGFAFVAAPYEMFASSGMYIKENSPFDMTMIFTCSNQYNAYFPTAEAFDFGCYESHTAVFARGVAEATASKFVEMLESIK